jgi:hypothetical protein
MMRADSQVEAARSRIQKLVEEIAALSKAEISSEEFFVKFLERAVAATDAKGGAVWLLASRGQDGKGEFQLCAQAGFESSLFQSDETQRASLLKVMSDSVTKRQSLVLVPEQPATTENPAPQPTMNRTPYPFLHIPLTLQDQPLGVLQIWLQPYVSQANYAEFITFLGSLTGYVEQHLQSRRLGSLVLETQKLQHLLRFTTDIAGTLDAGEAARMTANYGRDLVACERASVLWKDGDRWAVLAISGQEVVEKKSAMVKAMATFVEAHCAGETQVLSKKELLERASAAQVNNDENPAQLVVSGNATDQIDLAYFQLSHVVSAVVCPLLNREKQLVGAFFCESTSEGFFEPPPGKSDPPASRRVAEWIATHAARSLVAARDYQTLPLLPVMRRARQARLALTGERRKRNTVKLIAFGAFLFIALLWPVKNKVDGTCSLMATNRTAVVTEIPGRIERVLVREGARVKKGQVVAEMDTRRLETELEVTLQEKLRYLADADRSRATGDEAAAQVSLLQANALGATEAKLRMDIESAKLRSPIDGVVMTKDPELRVGEVVQVGSLFVEIDSFERWDLQVEVNEKDIGTLEKALNERGAIPAQFILYAQSAHIIHSQLADRQQISATAFPRERENVFLVTFRDPQIPAAMLPDLRPGLTGLGKIELGRQPAAVWAGKKLYRWFQFGWIARFFDWLFY